MFVGCLRRQYLWGCMYWADEDNCFEMWSQNNVYVTHGVSRLSTVWVKISATRCCAESVCVCCTHNNSVYVCCVQTESSVGENNCYKVVSVCVLYWYQVCGVCSDQVHCG